jgi:dynein heavy chain, axonemal
MTAATRWSLMIDPQLQGIRWITNRETASGLKIIQQSQAKYVDQVRTQNPVHIGCKCRKRL